MTLVSVGGLRAPSTKGLSVRTVVGYACGAVILARLLFLWQPLRSDEGGYLLAARNWHTGGEFLYGDYHVDRPPLLMLIFRLAALSDWDRTIRVLSIPFALVVVLAAARAGYLAAGPRAARCSAVVAAALVSSPALAADQADGELFAVPFVMVSIALTLEGHRRAGAAQWSCAVAAGAFGGAASLVKQNFLDALAFAAILVIIEAIQVRGITVRGRRTAAGTAIGVLLPYLALAGWASHVGIGGLRLWADLVAFRSDAFAVVWQGSSHAPVLRAVVLLALAGLSAIVPLAWAWVAACRAARSLNAERWAVTGGLVFGLVGVLAGGSFWPHYLLQLCPLLALAAGIGSATEDRGGRMRRWSTVAAGSTAAAVLVTTAVYATVPGVWYQQRIGDWLGQSSIPGDTALVAYGAPSILETADLPSPYPYLWSLPMRTLDPDLDRLRGTLAGPNAPTWVVQVNGLNSWQIDDHGRLRSLLASRYRVAATVCEHDIWLRSDQSRVAAPVPDC
jgi:hypothetical protein